MMKQWLMRRAVRRPVSRATTARHQFVGVQAALHQRLGAARAHQLHRLGRGIVAVCGVDHLEARDVEPGRRRRGSRSRADQDRRDKTELGRLDRALQRDRVAGMAHGGGHRRMLARAWRSTGRISRAAWWQPPPQGPSWLLRRRLLLRHAEQLLQPLEAPLAFAGQLAARGDHLPHSRPGGLALRLAVGQQPGVWPAPHALRRAESAGTGRGTAP